MEKLEIKKCRHEKFHTHAVIHRLKDSDQSEEIKAWHVDIKINCDECGMPFEFIGVSAGLNFNQPTVNLDFTELRMPIRPSEKTPVKEEIN